MDKSTAGENSIVEVGGKVKVKVFFHMRYLRLYLGFKQNSIDQLNRAPPVTFDMTANPSVSGSVAPTFRACPECPWACGPPKEMKVAGVVTPA
jgi:hypothetical protein